MSTTQANFVRALTAAANGNSANLGAYVQGPVTVHFWSAAASWNSATAKVQVSPDGTIWYDVTGASATADGYVNFTISAPHVRINVAGGLGSESIDCAIYRRHPDSN